MAHGSHRLAANSRAHALTVSLGAGVHLPLASRCVHILLSTLSCARDPCPAPRLICRPHPRPRRISGRSPLSHPPLLHALSHASLRFTPSSTRLRQRSHARIPVEQHSRSHSAPSAPRQCRSQPPSPLQLPGRARNSCAASAPRLLSPHRSILPMGWIESPSLGRAPSRYRSRRRVLRHSWPRRREATRLSVRRRSEDVARARRARGRAAGAARQLRAERTLHRRLHRHLRRQ